MTLNKVCIVGAGLSGTMLATYLAQRGIACDLYEKRPDIRKNFQSENRTIAMSISKRGTFALEGIGLSDFVKEHTIPKHSRMIHCEDGSTMVQRYGRESNHTCNTIDRKLLNETLLTKAEQTGLITCFFQHQCESLEPESGQISFSDLTCDKIKTFRYKWIIGADGLFSNVRRLLEAHHILKTEFLEVNYGYRELLIPSDAQGNYILQNNHVHLWPRKNYIMVGLPSKGGKFTCNLFLPAEGELSLSSIQTNEEVVRLFKEKFPTALSIMPTLTEDYFKNAASKIHAIKSSIWNYKDKVLLIGDAAHAIVPFFAMGMNTSFEDCTIFDNLMDRFNNNISQVIDQYEKHRKHDTDAISDLSYNNFNEISNSPAKNYHLKWKLDRIIWDLFPDKWMPLYPMVAFSQIPLSTVASRAVIQQEIIQNIVENFNIDQIENIEFENLIKTHLAQILNEVSPLEATS